VGGLTSYLVGEHGGHARTCYSFAP
jgi:hypothetical protein